MPRTTKSRNATTLGTRIGRNIKAARTRLGVTQSELAEALDIDSVTVSRIETGAQLPSLDRLDQIARSLDVSLASLVSDLGTGRGFGEMVAEATKALPFRERDFLYNFIVDYVQHWRTAKK
jgi:transcriptional regulator with XRE-family HTH domain